MEEVFENQLSEHLKTLEDFKLNTYIPKTEEVAADFSAKSKFGGFPYLKQENSWANCPNCNKPMQFFLQLNLATLPEKQGKGLFQLFYCLEDFLAECRVVTNFDENEKLELNLADPFPQKEIMEWELSADFPHGEDYWDLEIEEPEDEIIVLMDERAVGVPYEGDKLFGWPAWEQESEFPTEEQTDQQMKLFFQLSSKENLPHMFGDDGKFYIYYCYNEANELQFKTNEAGA